MITASGVLIFIPINLNEQAQYIEVLNMLIAALWEQGLLEN
jgi:hypothetical protein